MSRNHQSLSVFMCHTSADKPAVRDLYRKLQSEGFKPWLDEMDLLPGQDWKMEILRAVRGADVVIVCLSKASVSKTGYVQKEIRYALDAALERPEGTIFLIPLRLEPCEVPSQLRQWHWVNLFDEAGYGLLVSALQRCAKPNDDPKHSTLTASKRRAVHVVWICDVSGSTAGTKIKALNGALRESGPLMRVTASKYPEADVLVRAIAFSSQAVWHIPPTTVDEFEWSDLSSGGATALGTALVAVAAQLMLLPEDESMLPPILVLISDGWPTDDFKKGLETLMRSSWGKKSLRIGIAQGQYAPLDVLQQFAGQGHLAPLQVSNSRELQIFVNWVSTSVLESTLDGVEVVPPSSSWTDISW